MLRKIAFVVLALMIVGCSQEQTAQQTSQTAPNSADKTEHQLVFFINPDGAPCQMQGKILDEMAADLKGKVTIRPVKTTVQSDLDTFYAYGIRALPTLLLADAGGKEIKRLPPGVHPAETIRNLVSQVTGQ